MAVDPINIGSVPDDGTGDPIRTAFGKVNANEAFLDGVAAGLAGGATVSDQTLREWAEAGAYEATAVTFDSDQVVTTATVAWPDGSAGTFTTTTKSAAWLAVDAYTVSHAASGKTVTQSSVTRDTDGNVTTKPALSVA